MILQERNRLKSRIKKAICTITVMSMILGLSQGIGASAKRTDINKETELSVLTNSAIPLYNDNDEVIAFHYELNNGGYIIVNSDGSDFIEYSLEETNLELEKKEKYYYNSPCSIYEKIDNSTVENCATNEEIEIEDLDFKIEQKGSSNQEAATVLATSVVSATATTTVEEKKLSHATKKYDYNYDKRCGSVAGAILLRYYNDYVNTKYVASSYETSDGKKLINLLTNKYLGHGTTYSTLRSGLNQYLSDRGITKKFQVIRGRNSIPVFNKIRSYIKNDRPVIVGLTGNTTYGEHWVVGTGYSLIYNAGIGYGYIVIFNDGLGETNVRLNLYYVDGCQFIE